MCIYVYTGYVCTTCFASVVRYVALKMKYIELESALIAKCHVVWIRRPRIREIIRRKHTAGPRSIMTFHFQWAT